MSAEREKHEAALSQIHDVVRSTKEQFELCGDALDKLRDDYTTEQASNA